MLSLNLIDHVSLFEEGSLLPCLEYLVGLGGGGQLIGGHLG